MGKWHMEIFWHLECVRYVRVRYTHNLSFFTVFIRFSAGTG